MFATRRSASAILHSLAIGLLPAAPLAGLALVRMEPPIRLFRVMTIREDLLLGLTDQDLAALGAGPVAERLARRIVAEGQLSGWRYVVGRGADGAPQLAARHRVAVLRQDALLVEPYHAALPVLPPPAA
ncbi:hypothetical protein [Falsiroseomonas selenitidurans]|uniref:Uncharacterized protein n=1 Tax=Falsiroseomonas selenitidurans TaxID=2716335 RepID=A0ABX1E9B6_9PROT|nr:hypothetical protein [Falsiroseomonas selenitidurans]NKC33781.1 hypothetical protein [Falsiroseomonas selenitidurans]